MRRSVIRERGCALQKTFRLSLHTRNDNPLAIAIFIALRQRFMQLSDYEPGESADLAGVCVLRNWKTQNSKTPAFSSKIASVEYVSDSTRLT
jgi:hypothetical protein